MGPFSGSSSPCTAWLFKTGQIGFPETSIITRNLRCAISQKSEDLVCTSWRENEIGEGLETY